MGNNATRMYGVDEPIDVAVDSATVIEVGDMVYLDTDDAKPASTAALWNTSETLTAQALKDSFLGIAMDASAAGETDTIRVSRSGVHRMTCASAAYEIGATVGGDQDGASLFLHAQQVKATAAATETIGIVQQSTNGASVTKILVRIFSQTLDGVAVGE
jgi:hypothetical protein